MTTRRSSNLSLQLGVSKTRVEYWFKYKRSKEISEAEVTLNHHQLSVLENEYAVFEYVADNRANELANELQISRQQVFKWFRNKRSHHSNNAAKNISL